MFCVYVGMEVTRYKRVESEKGKAKKYLFFYIENDTGQKIVVKANNFDEAKNFTAKIKISRITMVQREFKRDKTGKLWENIMVYADLDGEDEHQETRTNAFDKFMDTIGED